MGVAAAPPDYEIIHFTSDVWNDLYNNLYVKYVWYQIKLCMITDNLYQLNRLLGKTAYNFKIVFSPISI